MILSTRGRARLDRLPHHIEDNVLARFTQDGSFGASDPEKNSPLSLVSWSLRMSQSSTLLVLTYQHAWGEYSTKCHGNNSRYLHGATLDWSGTQTQIRTGRKKKEDENLAAQK